MAINKPGRTTRAAYINCMKARDAIGASPLWRLKRRYELNHIVNDRAFRMLLLLLLMLMNPPGRTTCLVIDDSALGRGAGSGHGEALIIAPN